MAIIIKSLLEAQLSVPSGQPAVSSVYQAPASPAARTAVVRSMRLANADANVPATVMVECKTATTSRDTEPSPPWRKASAINFVVPPNGAVILDDEITLNAGDQVKITLAPPGSGTAKLDMVLSGIEREVP